MKDLVTLYGDWENTEKYFIIGSWIDAIENKVEKRK